MKLGMNSAAFYGRGETEDNAARLPAYGLDTCEIFLETPGEYSADFGCTVRQALGDLPCTSVHPLGTQFEPQLFARSQRQTEDAFDRFRGVCDAGQALGARYYVFHGPFGVHSPLEPGRINRLPETFARMQQIAAQRGLRILWETVHWCSLRRPEDVKVLRELIPDIGFVLDVKQVLRGGSDLFAMLAAMEDRVCHVHALDVAADGSLCLPGEGAVDWPRLMGQLRTQGFDGAVILEPYEQLTRDEARLRQSLQFLRSVLQ